MKKNLTVLSMSTIMLFSAACKNGNTPKGTTQYADTNKKDADSIIKFNNAVIKLTDNYNTYLKHVGQNVTTVESWIQSPSSITTLMAPFDMSYTPTYGENPNNPPRALSSADQSFFKGNIAVMNDLYRQIKTTYKSLDDYIQAEDYKDDQFAEAKQLIGTLDSMGKKFYATEDAVLLKLGDIADDAERVILKDHPLKDFIYAMKDDGSAARKVFHLLDSAADNYKPAAMAIEAAYNSLDSQYQKHSTMKVPDKEEYSSKAHNFARFNDDVNAYLGELRKVMRDAAASGKITIDRLKELNYKLESLRSSYNNFVD